MGCRKGIAQALVHGGLAKGQRAINAAAAKVER